LPGDFLNVKPRFEKEKAMTIEEKRRIVYGDSIHGQFLRRREEEKRSSRT